MHTDEGSSEEDNPGFSHIALESSLGCLPCGAKVTIMEKLPRSQLQKLTPVWGLMLSPGTRGPWRRAT